MDTSSSPKIQNTRVNFLVKSMADLCNVSFRKTFTKKSTSQTIKAFAIWLSMKEIQPTYYKRYACYLLRKWLISYMRLLNEKSFLFLLSQPFLYIIKLIKWTVKLVAWAIIQTSLLPVDASDMGMDYDTGK